MRQLLVATVLAACLCAAVAVELSLGDVATQRALSSSEVVTYGPCDEPKCPAIQKPTGPPPPGYECNCADPSEHPDCGCNLKTGCCAEKEKEAQKECACKNAKIQTRARTRVIDPNYKAPPPKNEQRKFNPPTEAPNPLPPVDGDQCRPNVAKLGPGNCRRGGSSATCGDKESNCKNKDNASMGFVAAALTNEIDPTDQPESCDHQPGDADITAKESGSQGTSYATVKLKNKCTGKSRYLHKANIYIQAPKVVTGNGQAVPGVSGSAVSGSSGSGSAFDPAIGSSASASQSAIASAIAQLASQSAAQSAIQSALAASQSAPQSAALPASVTPSQLESMIQNAVKNALGSQSGARPVPQSASSSASGSAAPASASGSAAPASASASLSGSLAKALLSSSSLSALSGSSSGSGAITPISSSSKSK